MALFSVIVPFFNSKHTIKSTLFSIKNQTIKDFECILINDGSKDKSGDIVSDYIGNDERFILIKNNTNIGVVNSRNKAIKNSSGRFITFLDSDDLWHPRFLEECLNKRKLFINGLAITHSNLYKISISEKKINYSLVNFPKQISHKNILNKNFMALSTVCIDKSIVGNFEFQNVRPEDYKLWIDLLYIKKFISVSLDKPLSFYRISKDQRSNNKFFALKRIYKFYGKLPRSNFLKKIKRTIIWVFYNCLERFSSRNTIDKFSKNYLNSIFFN